VREAVRGPGAERRGGARRDLHLPERGRVDRVGQHVQPPAEVVQGDDDRAVPSGQRAHDRARRRRLGRGGGAPEVPRQRAHDGPLAARGEGLEEDGDARLEVDRIPAEAARVVDPDVHAPDVVAALEPGERVAHEVAGERPVPREHRGPRLQRAGEPLRP
jgi:hypothetical protein